VEAFLRSGDDLARRWRTAEPFPHLVLDDFLPPERLDAVRRAVAAEPHWSDRTQLFEFMASAVEVSQPGLRALKEDFLCPRFLGRLREVTGHAPTRLELRSYVYSVGDYALPHTDCWEPLGRLVAFAFYLLPRESFTGGELDLYAAEADGHLMRSAVVGRTIQPKENRIVLFEVSHRSLHRVREVTRGARASLAGWFVR